jgi:glycosyltransferase involved in cell wall biosynthesis
MQHIESSTIKISIVICTYNRALILKDTLSNFLNCVKTNIYYELLVIDNNSCDNTREVVMAFAKNNSTINYYFESKQGLSEARNTGINASSGNIIAFVDDDVFFDPFWLIEVVRIFQDYPEASCMGGKSIPQFEIGKPDWITDNLLTLYGSTNSGDTIKWMNYPEYPFGLNMAFKRDVFDRIGMFNSALGRKNKNLLSNEESEVFWRINQADLKVIYTPKALLHHRIPAERTCKEWVLARYYWQGISSIVFDQLITPRSKLVLLIDAIWDGWKLLRQSTGHHWSPRKAYWHYKSTKFSERCSQSFVLGRVKQMSIESLTFK